MIAYFDHLSSKLNRKGVIKVMGQGAEKDELGWHPAVPQTVATVWCQVVPQTGSLLSGRPGETALARTTHKIVMRYRKDITPDMWVEVDGEKYDILYVMDPYLKHISLELFCEVRFDDLPARSIPAPKPEPKPEPDPEQEEEPDGG